MDTIIIPAIQTFSTHTNPLLWLFCKSPEKMKYLWPKVGAPQVGCEVLGWPMQARGTLPYTACSLHG